MTLGESIAGANGAVPGAHWRVRSRIAWTAAPWRWSSVPPAGSAVKPGSAVEVGGERARANVSMMRMRGYIAVDVTLGTVRLCRMTICDR